MITLTKGHKKKSVLFVIILLALIFLQFNHLNKVKAPLIIFDNSSGSTNNLVSELYLKQDSLQIVLSNHGPIDISSNANFITTASSESWQGNGSINNPFIIENYYINVTTNTDGIVISNTDLYFIIRNVELNASYSSTNEGIRLLGVKHGTLFNNSIHYFTNGINLGIQSSFNDIMNNSIDQSTYSAISISGFNNTISYNLIQNNPLDGISIPGSNNTYAFNSFKNNQASSFSVNGNYNTFINNTSFDNGGGFDLWGDNNYLVNNTVNKQNDTCYDFHGSKNILIQNQAISCLFSYEVSSAYNILMNNSGTRNTFGFDILASNNYLSGNKALYNNGSGFNIENSDLNYLENNLAFANRYWGYYFSNSNDNVLLLNNATANHLDGFALLSNSINNTFENNTAFGNGWSGFYMEYSNNNNYTSNNATANLRSGFNVYVTGQQTFTKNIAESNTFGFQINSNQSILIDNQANRNTKTGFFLSNSNDTKLSKNVAIENFEYGILINGTSKTNTINLNVLVLNQVQNVQDNSNNTNIWKSNSFSDYSGNGIYHISGTTSAVDSSPIVDTDNDGMPNWYEVLYGLNYLIPDGNLDADHDGMPNYWEYTMHLNPTVANGQLDNDQDGMPNLWEYQMGLNASFNDASLDKDNDGMPNLWEYQMGLNASFNDANLDKDNDGLVNYQEYIAGTNASNPDTDGDSLLDGYEVNHHLNPLVNDTNLDFDKDGLTNIQEYQLGTDPSNPDSDGDFATDGQEIAAGTNPLNASVFDAIIANSTITALFIGLLFVIVMLTTLLIQVVRSRYGVSSENFSSSKLLEKKTSPVKERKSFYNQFLVGFTLLIFLFFNIFNSFNLMSPGNFGEGFLGLALTPVSFLSFWISIGGVLLSVFIGINLIFSIRFIKGKSLQQILGSISYYIQNTIGFLIIIFFIYTLSTPLFEYTISLLVILTLLGVFTYIYIEYNGYSSAIKGNKFKAKHLREHANAKFDNSILIVLGLINLTLIGRSIINFQLPTNFELPFFGFSLTPVVHTLISFFTSVLDIASIPFSLLHIDFKFPHILSVFVMIILGLVGTLVLVIKTLASYRMTKSIGQSSSSISFYGQFSNFKEVASFTKEGSNLLQENSLVLMCFTNIYYYSFSIALLLIDRSFQSDYSDMLQTIKGISVALLLFSVGAFTLIKRKIKQVKAPTIDEENLIKVPFFCNDSKIVFNTKFSNIEPLLSSVTTNYFKEQNQTPKLVKYINYKKFNTFSPEMKIPFILVFFRERHIKDLTEIKTNLKDFVNKYALNDPNKELPPIILINRGTSRLDWIVKLKTKVQRKDFESFINEISESFEKISAPIKSNDYDIGNDELMENASDLVSILDRTTPAE